MSETTLALVNAKDVPYYRPDWLPDDVETYTDITPGLLNLGYCMESNPAPFEFAEIARCTVTQVDKDGTPDSMGEGEWHWLVLLKDGRHFAVRGWHDYTGWDCQSGAEYQQVEP